MDILEIISENQKAYHIKNSELIAGIINSVRWWRIKNGKSQLTLVEAMQLLNRVNHKLVVRHNANEVELK